MFDSTPPLPNIIPFPLEWLAANDTPEFRAACRELTATSGLNPLFLQYGTNLLALTGPRPNWTDFPFKSYEIPPPLEETTLPEEAVFLDQLNKHGNTLLFTVRIGDEVHLLKIFADRTILHWPNRTHRYDRTRPLFVEYDPFEAEKDAYAHLLHHGVCAKGIVPHCFGHLQLGRARMEEILALPGISWECEVELRRRKRPLDALLLQYFPDARRLTQDDATEKLAETAMRALWQVHAAYVQHGDIAPRNILVRPDGRVVLVDFNRARLPCGVAPCAKEDLLGELSEMWTLFYQQYLPNKRIGWVPPQPVEFEGLADEADDWSDCGIVLHFYLAKSRYGLHERYLQRINIFNKDASLLDAREISAQRANIQRDSALSLRLPLYRTDISHFKGTCQAAYP
ncbi:hypothetical protein PsYK624_103140 [Phanerochaete sordida]|uniref:Uncharacterized protein n=1 Tax=Phanerochaete sordida TaxID=48140 RepID=A0A9P3GFT8_9APHY|nr:hypothetical protein PsYK624_103140 [Phanerochaete sordida]